MNDLSVPSSEFSDPDVIRQLLTTARTIAIVGISPRPDRPSHQVATYLQRHRYRVVPVNPSIDEVLGERCFPTLHAIGEPVDLVDVFRNPAECPAIAAQAVAAGARAIWLQLGVVSLEAARIATDAGITVVMDRCTRIEHGRLATFVGR
jgi:predicted CoA-binding protein